MTHKWKILWNYNTPLGGIPLWNFLPTPAPHRNRPQPKLRFWPTPPPGYVIFGWSLTCRLGSRQCSALWFRVIGCIEQKGRNESWAYENVRQKQRNQGFLTKCWTGDVFLTWMSWLQMALESPLRLQKLCSRYLTCCSGSGQCSALWFRVIGCIEKKDATRAEPMKMCDKSSKIKVFSQNAKLKLLFSPKWANFKWP